MQPRRGFWWDGIGDFVEGADLTQHECAFSVFLDGGGDELEVLVDDGGGGGCFGHLWGGGGARQGGTQQDKSEGYTGNELYGEGGGCVGWELQRKKGVCEGKVKLDKGCV